MGLYNETSEIDFSPSLLSRGWGPITNYHPIHSIGNHIAQLEKSAKPYALQWNKTSTLVRIITWSRRSKRQEQALSSAKRR
jgi:hypothetical protein